MDEAGKRRRGRGSADRFHRDPSIYDRSTAAAIRSANASLESSICGGNTAWSHDRRCGVASPQQSRVLDDLQVSPLSRWRLTPALGVYWTLLVLLTGADITGRRHGWWFDPASSRTTMAPTAGRAAVLD